MSFVASIDAALHHAEALRCGSVRDLCDAFDSMSGSVCIGACALMLVVVVIADRVVSRTDTNP